MHQCSQDWRITVNNICTTKSLYDINCSSSGTEPTNLSVARNQILGQSHRSRSHIQLGRGTNPQISDCYTNYPLERIRNLVHNGHQWLQNKIASTVNSIGSTVLHLWYRHRLPKNVADDLYSICATATTGTLTVVAFIICLIVLLELYDRYMPGPRRTRTGKRKGFTRGMPVLTHKYIRFRAGHAVTILPTRRRQRNRRHPQRISKACKPNYPWLLYLPDWLRLTVIWYMTQVDAQTLYRSLVRKVTKTAELLWSWPDKVLIRYRRSPGLVIHDYRAIISAAWRWIQLMTIVIAIAIYWILGDPWTTADRFRWTAVLRHWGMEIQAQKVMYAYTWPKPGTASHRQTEDTAAG